MWTACLTATSASSCTPSWSSRRPAKSRATTRTLTTNSQLEEAAAILRRGGLVAFPTETVYGLGANALDEDAVRRIYAAKGRPSTSPLIVHIAGAAMGKRVAREWPETAAILTNRFWPGPLTLVLPKQKRVPAIV
ncbi:MAG: L-threonylcarbamoyladenylate synthase, partial [Acidobacteria bacterium]|nr:L-threonylcarbamoyladenylate synthase [Acidobacteriota bacterium]